jgi:DNA-binding transcriptional LysR family regulator
LWLVCGSTNPLAAIPLLPVNQLSTLKYVLRESETALRETVDQALAVIGVPSSQVELELGPTIGIIEILKKLHYVSFLPRFAVEKHVLAGELHHIAVDNFTIQRSLWIARHRSDLKHLVAEAFITMMRGL